jgi:copper chaperone NosL
MKNARSAVGLLAVVMLTSCSTVAPVKIAMGDQCFRCRRTILSERVAAESIDTNGFVSKFRGPGCMATYIAAHRDQKATLFVTDFATGKMVAPDVAFYVPEIVDRNTGETDYRAFRDQADANRAASELKATYVRWTDVLDTAH